jgi:uncharacterized membrane protein
MKFGVVAGVSTLVAVLSCGTDGRNFGAGGAGSGGQGGDESTDSGGSAGNGAVTVAGGGSGQNPPDGNAGSGAAGAPGEPEDLCVGKVCDSPPAEECLSGTEFQTYDQIGSCDAGTCSYTPRVIACTCEEGACTTDPCIGVTCDAPPSAVCKDASTLTEYAESGSCSAGSCSYEATEAPCPFGCANGACKADSCANLTCNTPPGSTCKNATTRTTFAASGTCSEGTCSYAATDTACTGATAKCKDLGASSKCVTCLANSDCSNGGTCNASGACVCSARFNGPRCEFQVFRGIGKLTGDTSSVAFNISHDGSIVVGASYRSDGFAHAVRSINGSLQFIAEPASLTPSTGCRGMAVDSSGAVLLHCEGGSTFLHTNAGADVAIDGGTAVDISLDGKVIIGVGVGSPSQGFRKVGSVTTPLGELHAGGGSSVFATNGDGSVVVGDASLNGGGRAATRWTAALGLIALPKLVNWYSPAARDVSTDGKVIVGHTKDPADTVAVKWSGADLSPSLLGPGQALCTNSDGTVIGGYSFLGDGSQVATIWDSGGVQRAVKDLLGATPDLTSDWTLAYVVGISDDGKFLVGSGTHAGKSEGWVAHLP